MMESETPCDLRKVTFSDSGVSGMLDMNAHAWATVMDADEAAAGGVATAAVLLLAEAVFQAGAHLKLLPPP